MICNGMYLQRPWVGHVVKTYGSVWPEWIRRQKRGGEDLKYVRTKSL